MSEPKHGHAALRAGTEAHYRDAARYDREYRTRKHDVAFYVEMAEEHARGPVLELGAGTGRVSVALARRGFEVVALDRMREMLDGLEARLAKEPPEVRARVRAVHGEIASARLGERFSLVISPFNVLMHCYVRADFEAAMATVLAHLAPGGALVFDVRMPDLRELCRESGRIFGGERAVHREAFDYDVATQIQMITSITRERSGELTVRPLAHRQFFPAELEALLHYNGLAIESRWGDFERGPMYVTCESQVIVARAR